MHVCLAVNLLAATLEQYALGVIQIFLSVDADDLLGIVYHGRADLAAHAHDYLGSISQVVLALSVVVLQLGKSLEQPA